MGGGKKKMLPLNTVRVKTKELDSEEMRFGESVGSNLWFDFGSPWLSVRCKEGLCVSLGALPAALMNLLRSWEWLMHLFMEIEKKKPKKQVAAKFTSSNHFPSENKIVLSAGAFV